MWGAEGCRRQSQKSKSTQILNPAKENHVALRFSLTCSGPSSLGCLCAIYLCTGALAETLGVAPRGCRPAARAALAPWGDHSQEHLRFWQQDGYQQAGYQVQQSPRYSNPPPGSRDIQERDPWPSSLSPHRGEAGRLQEGGRAVRLNKPALTRLCFPGTGGWFSLQAHLRAEEGCRAGVPAGSGAPRCQPQPREPAVMA